MCELQNDDELFCPESLCSKAPLSAASCELASQSAKLSDAGNLPRLACGANAVNQSVTSCKLSEVFITS